MKADALLVHPPVNFFLRKRPFQHSSFIGYGLLHVAASLIRMGYKVALCDLGDVRVSTNLVPDIIRKSLEKCDPVVIGIELNWVNFSKGAIQTAEFYKKIRPDIPVILGGTHASIFSTEIVQGYNSVVDAVLKGEAEITFPNIIENIEKGKTLLNVGGVTTYKKGRIYESPLVKNDIYEKIDDIPPYSYKDIFFVHSDKTRYSLNPCINTCRGPCIYNCIYCVGGRNRRFLRRESFTVHSSEWIINQMKLLIEEGAKEINFQDYFFLSGEKRLIEVARAIRDENINEEIVGINMTAIPGVLNGETLEELSKAGVYNIDYGIESGSDRMLRVLNRSTSKKQILDSIEVTIAKGIIPYTWWMTGLPKETPEDVEDTLNFIMKTIELGSIPRWITPLVILPGTILYEQANEYNVSLRLRSFKDFSIYSDLGEKAISWYPEAISHETENFDIYDILRQTIKLKFEIFSKRDEIINNFKKNMDAIISYHPSISVDQIENRIKDDIGYLLKTFF